MWITTLNYSIFRLKKQSEGVEITAIWTFKTVFLSTLGNRGMWRRLTCLKTKNKGIHIVNRASTNCPQIFHIYFHIGS